MLESGYDICDRLDLNKIFNKRIKTGIRDLDLILDGGLKNRLYCIGGGTSTGKSSLVIQIADNIAKQNKVCILFSLEMEKEEIIIRSMSRESFEEDDVDGFKFGSSKPDKDVFEKAKTIYQKYSNNIKIATNDFGIEMEEIEKEINEYMRQNSEPPVIIIDYIQLIKLSDYNNNAKDRLDSIMAKLKSMCIKYKLPIIAVSSINRTSYNHNTQLNSFKESGAIEYSADVVIGIDTKENAPNIIFLSILKNRTGKKDQVIKLEYQPAYAYFTDWGNSNYN